MSYEIVSTAFEDCRPHATTWHVACLTVSPSACLFVCFFCVWLRLVL